MTSPSAAPSVPEPDLPDLDDILSTGELRAARKLGLTDLETMLRSLPRRWNEPARLRELSSVAEGEEVSALVTVESARVRTARNRPLDILEARVTDGTGSLPLTFFLPRGKRGQHHHARDWHVSRLREGAQILVFGIVSIHVWNDTATAQITHPGYELVDAGTDLDYLLRPRPVYPLRKNIRQAVVRSAYAKALAHADAIPGAIPPAVRERHGLDPLGAALRRVHTPRDHRDIAAGLAHLRTEEALVLQTIFASRRAQDERTPAPPLATPGSLTAGLAERLPFTLTDGQRTAIDALAASISRPHPTATLLQGDVGSGKTVVALHAMLRAVDSGHQAVLLAPTDVLARQHHATIEQLLGPLGRAGQLDADPAATTVRLLTGSLSTAERRRALLDITSGEAGLVIGTHALLEDRVEFFSLGLAIIDEQHRFGVDHRRRLRAKGPGGAAPHTLVMSATPIPRTAAIALAGDLDILNLTEVPARRAGVRSHCVPEQLPQWETRMWSRLAEEVAAGRQAFVVCPRIDEQDEAAPATASAQESAHEESSAPEARSVLEVARQLRRRPELAGLRIDILHGRLSAEEKTAVMQRMDSGETDILVSTTVIEVGVDVTNASVMAVLDAERFGVSQLHQLRGRVGRGEHPGIAFFATRTPQDGPVVAHLREIAATTDGFALAELDLRSRGFGDLLGDQQSGRGLGLRYLDVQRDARLIDTARDDARALIEKDPSLTQHPALARAVALRLADTDPDVERS